MPLPELSWFSDAGSLMREAIRDHASVGAVLPSGISLARALTATLHSEKAVPVRVLEVGAGTGAVTEVLLDRLPPGSTLDAVELNPRLATSLRRKVDSHPRRRALAGVTVHPVAIEQLITPGDYDLVICCLPLTNFAPHHVEELLEGFRQALRPGGRLTWFTYVGTIPVRLLLSGPRTSARLRSVQQLLGRFRQTHGAVRSTAWANVPPAHVWQITPVHHHRAVTAHSSS